MKTLLCCIARMENDYIREWVEYNKNIGFDKICLFDNNYDGEQNFHDVIGDYIENGYVILKDYRNKIACQLDAYTECYSEYGNEYDWIAFFDSDEFLTFYKHKSVSEYLSDERFNGFYAIRINWSVYGDNDMLYNDGRPLLERFKYPISVYHYSHSDNIENTKFKTIIRGHQIISLNGGYGFSFICPHRANIYPVCDNVGNVVNFKDDRILPNYGLACLRHYNTKTAREYCNKIRRGFPDHDVTLIKGREEYLIKNVFFVVNDITPEKVQIFKDVLGVDVSYLLNNNQ